MNYIIYFQLENGKFRILHSHDESITTELTIDIKKFPYRYYLFKGYDASDDGLRSYHTDFCMWTDELKENKVLNIDYTKYYSHHNAVELTFKRLCKGRYEDHEIISGLENSWFSKCHNGGLTYCNPGTYDCYGYDFKLFYPSILGSENFYIPTKAGIEYVLDDLSAITFGFYRVEIVSSNHDFKKIFAFSKDDVYTHTSLKWAIKHKDKFDVSITLIQDDEPNAYLYHADDIIQSDEVFSNWIYKIKKLRNLFPKNKLVKNLASALWGHLSKAKVIHKTYDEIKDEDLDVGNGFESDYRILEHHVYDCKEYYDLADNKNPYHYNIRLKPFLVSHGRVQTAKVALENLDNVVRIQTDNITFKTSLKWSTINKYKDLVLEDKTTGMITWSNCNKYANSQIPSLEDD